MTQRRGDVRFVNSDPIVLNAAGGADTPRPQLLPVGASKVRAVDSMFDAIAGRYELVNRLLTLGMDRGWRRKTVAALALDRDAIVLDVACGTGDLSRALLAGALRPVGVDRSAGMLESARGRVPLLRGDATALSFGSGAAAGVVCGFALRNFVAIEPFLDECARVLRPGGRLALLEVSEPDNPVVRAGHAAYFRGVVPIVGGLLSDRAAYRYLPRSTAYLPPPAELVRMVRSAGFEEVRRKQLSFGIAQLITGTRTGTRA